jgi:cobalt-zinc-cadmium efflux system outer membrane protein
LSTAIVFRWFIGGLVLSFALVSLRAQAQEAPLRLGRAEVAELARSRSPDVIVATRRVGESRGQLVGAEVLLRQSPWLDVAAGPRFRPNDTIPDAEVSLGIPLEIYGRRGAEIDAARGAIARDESLVGTSQQQALAEALAAYYRALRATAEDRWARQQLDLTTALLRTAERRRDAGEIGDPDVALLRVSAARARRAVTTTEANREMSVTALKGILGIPGDRSVEVTGELGSVSSEFTDALLRTAPTDRPEIVAADAALRASRLDVDAEQRAAWPVPVLRTTYQREEGNNVFLLGIGLPLPIFQRNQGPIAIAQARTQRLEAEREALAIRIDAEVRVARRRYQAALDGLHILETDAIPAIEDGLRLTQRAFELGQSDLTRVLVVQRELADTRREQFDALVELADAGISLQRALGVLR